MSDILVYETADQETLISRLSQYTLVNSVYQGYNNIKESNTYLKLSLETAESYTQPVLQKLDDTLHLDEKGVAILDKIETTASGLTNKVSDYYNQGAQYYSNTKETAVETGKVLVATANRPVNQILDITEALVNKILPPDLDSYPLESDDEENEFTGDESPLVSHDYEQEDHLSSNPIPRLKEMGSDVSKRLQNIALAKLQNINFTSPQQTAAMTYVISLIQYATKYVDLDGKTKLLKENAAIVQTYIDEKREEAVKLVNPAKEIIEQQTSDIKDLSVKAIVTVVSSVAHLTEILRRQIIDRVPDISKFHVHLAEVTRRTKAAVLNLREQELSNFMLNFQETSKAVLQSILDLTYAYTPEKLLPLFIQLSTNLSSWRLSLSARLANDSNKDDEIPH